MALTSKEIGTAHLALVDNLVRCAVIRTPAIERAFRKVPRHMFLQLLYRVATDPFAADFIQTNDPCRVYTNAVAVIDRARNITSGAPGVIARQIEQLAPMEGMRVLHVGTGTGYYTAILAELAGESGSVVGVEYEEDLAELSAALLGRAGYTTVTVRQGDGTFGVPEAAPFDRIMVSGGAADISPAWISQLADEGRLVVPFCHAGPAGSTVGGGAMLTVDKAADTLSGHITDIAFFAPLKGASAPTEEDGAVLADGLMRWFALSEFLRTSLRVRIVLRSEGREPPAAGSVPWYLETRSAIMWVEPN